MSARALSSRVSFVRLIAELDTDELQRPLNFLIPKFISFFQHPHKDIRKYAIATVNVFLQHKPLALLTNMESYMAVS